MNIVISYLAGSGGELLSNPLINSKKYFSAVSHHMLSPSGRMVPKFNQNFVKLFPPLDGKHCYQRDWAADWEKLLDLNKNWLLLTTDPDQAQFLKSKIKDKVLIISITYNELIYQYVLDSFCYKILDSKNYLTRDQIGENFLKTVSKSDEHRKWFINLGTNGQLGSWYKKEYSRGNIHFPPKFHHYSGDFTVELTTLLTPGGLVKIYKDLSLILGQVFDLEYIKKIHSSWLEIQNNNYINNFSS